MDPQLMEELMMDRLQNPGLGQGLASPSPFDAERRRRMIGAGGGQGMGGPEQGLARLLPWLMGARYANMTGFPGNVNFTGLSQAVQNANIAPENFAPAGPNQQAVTNPMPTTPGPGASPGPPASGFLGTPVTGNLGPGQGSPQPNVIPRGGLIGHLQATFGNRGGGR